VFFFFFVGRMPGIIKTRGTAHIALIKYPHLPRSQSPSAYATEPLCVRTEVLPLPPPSTKDIFPFVALITSYDVSASSHVGKFISVSKIPVLGTKFPCHSQTMRFSMDQRVCSLGYFSKCYVCRSQPPHCVARL